MAIIYSYPDNANILLTDLLIGTSTVRIAGKKKNLTKNFTVEALGNFISLNNPTVWGTIVGNLQDQTDLWGALESKQGNITLTTNGVDGPSTFIADVLNIPDYSAGVVIPTLAQVLLAGNTATNNITLIGNVTASSFIKTGGTNLQYLMADGSVTTGGGSPTGPAGGDLSGTYPNPNVVWANGQPTYDLVYYPLPTGTVSQYIDGTGAFQTFPTITPDLLTEQTIDSYIGSRLRPTNPLSNGFYVNRNVNGAVGITGINTSTGNSAVSILDVGIGAIYTKTAYIAKFGANYYVPLLAGKGGLLGTEEVFVGSTDNNDVSILTGTTFTAITRKFTVKANGQLLVQTTPTTGTTSDYILLRDTSGNVKQIAYPTIPTVGTWGTLNYPTWTTGTPFVKMTAAGTFALDTNTYLTGITSSDVTTALGYTPVTNARTLTINGVGYDLSADRSWTIATNNGTVTNVAALTIGTSGSDLSSTVSNSTTTPVITLNVPTASDTNRGALSTTDWSTFNNKANANTELNIRRTGYTVYNEFLASITNGSYSQATVSAGTITSATGNVDANHFGVVTFNSSTTSNSGFYSALNPSAAVGISCTLVANLQTDLVFKTPVTISPTTTIRFGIGLGSITATDFTNGFYFEIVGNSLVGKTAASNVRSSSSAYTISANTWYHLRVIATSTTLITYYVYDMDGLLLFSTTLNTNLPTTTVVMNNIVVATNSGVVATILGYFDLISITFPSMVRGALN